MSFTDPFMPETKIIDFADCWNALLSKSTCFYSRTPIFKEVSVDSLLLEEDLQKMH